MACSDRMNGRPRQLASAHECGTWRAAGQQAVLRGSALLAMAALMLAGGCAHPTPPTVGVRGIAPGRVYLNMATLEIKADVINNADQTLHLTGADYALEIGGNQLGTGHYRGDATLLPGATVGVTLPLQLDYTRLIGALVAARHNDLVRDGVVAAGLDGHFTFGTGLGHATAPLQALVALPVTQQAWGGKSVELLTPGFSSGAEREPAMPSLVPRH